MTREQASAEIIEWLHNMTKHGVPIQAAKRKALVVALEALQDEAFQNKWIPVSERLPAKDITVLVTTAWHDVDIARRTRDLWGGPDHWENECVAFDDESIIAWKFMPEPYEEDEEE